MPTGIILSTGSVGSTKEDAEAALRKNGYEVEAPEAIEDRKKLTTEQLDEARANKEFEHEDTEQETEPQRLSRRQKAVQKATEQLKAELKATKDRLEALEKGGKGKKEEAE